MIVKWLAASPTSFEANFNGFAMILDKDHKGDWPVYVRQHGRFRRSTTVGSTSGDAKSKVEAIANRVMKKIMASGITAQVRPIIIRSNKDNDTPKTTRQSKKLKAHDDENFLIR